MCKDLYLVFILALVEVAICQNPPKMPKVYLPNQKFSLPPICLDTPEWQDVTLSLKILSDMSEPRQQKSAFTSLMNLLKFILIKEELPGKAPVVIAKPRPKIVNAVTTLQNSQVLTKMEKVMARKPKVKMAPIIVNDNINIPDMLPVLRPRLRKICQNKDNVAKVKTAEVKMPCQNQNRKVTVKIPIVGINPSPCQCQKCVKPNCPITLIPVQPQRNCQCPRLPMVNPCPRLPMVNPKPVILNLGQNCNICQKLTKPKPVLACNRCDALNTLKVINSETIPLMQCYGNLLKKATMNILVPYCASKGIF